MVDIAGFVEETNRCATAGDVFDAFERILAAYGYDRICYSLFTDHPSIGQDAGHGVLKNYPADWMDHYTQNGYENLDPVRLLAAASRQPFRWRDLDRLIVMKPRNRRVMDEARDAGLLDGIAVPLHGPGGEIAGVGMASSYARPNLSLNEIGEVNLLCHQFHQAFSQVNRCERTAPQALPALSRREKDVLFWMARGKSRVDIGDILKISDHTVDSLQRRIYAKLEVCNQIGAVIAGVYHGLIQP